MRKMRRVKVALMAMVMAMGLSGCGAISQSMNSLHGSIFGNTYTIDTFDHFGTLTMQTHGEKIDIKGNINTTVDVSSDGSYVKDKELSSMITITIDGHEMKSCGDTLIFYEDGLVPDYTFEPVTNISSESSGLMDNTMIAGAVNDVKNSFGKAQVVVIKTPLGTPIYAFSGDKVTETVPDDLPKFTKLMVDGKALYLHRTNYQIIDKALLEK